MGSRKVRKIKHSKTKRKYKQRGGTYDELIEAVQSENVDLEQITRILSISNLTLDQIYDALMFAIMKNKIQVVELLLHQYDNDDENQMQILNKKNEAGYSPLPFALLEGNKEIVILLLQKGIDANDYNFDYFDFSGTNLHYMKIKNASFVNAKFIQTNLMHTEFIDCDFSNADMTNAILKDAVLINCDFINATLTNTNFTGATVTNPDFTDANINDAIGIIIPHTTDNGPPRPPHAITQDSMDFSMYRFHDNSNLSISSIYDDSYDSGEWLINENDNSFRPATPDFPPPPPTRKDILLRRNKVTLEKSKINPFTNSELKGFDTIMQEDIEYCSYIKDKNNLIFLYNNQISFIIRNQLKEIVDTDDNKIVYQCKNKDDAFQPRDENIISGPHLNMDVIGLFGIMIPLEQLDEVITGKHQIFIVEPIVGGKTSMPIASLNTRLGGNVVGANHCQANVPIQIGNISYLTNDVLQKQCVNKELLTKQSKIGGTRRKNNKRTKQNKSKRKVLRKTK